MEVAKVRMFARSLNAFCIHVSAITWDTTVIDVDDDAV
jgi:hypothetical protein